MLPFLGTFFGYPLEPIGLTQIDHAIAFNPVCGHPRLDFDLFAERSSHADIFREKTV